MHIELAPLAGAAINIATGVAAILLPPLIGTGIAWGLQKVGLANAQTQALLGAEANKALGIALDFAKGPGAIEVERYLDAVVLPDNKLSRAAAYAIAHWPDTFKKLGVDVNTPAGQQAIVRALTARMGPSTAASK